MTILSRLVAASILLGLPLLSAGKDLGTQMTVRGPSIFKEDFSTDSLTANWKVITGKWLLKEGALTAEHSGEKEQSTIRKELPFTDAVLQLDFKLGAGSLFHLSVNGVNGHTDHVCRVVVNEKGFQVRKDGAKTDPSDAGKLLATVSMDIAPGSWHTMLVEILGAEILARVDQSQIAFGSDPKIDRPKGSFGFPTGGNAILIDNVGVWKATPNPQWTSTKAKLQPQAGRGDSAPTRP